MYEVAAVSQEGITLELSPSPLPTFVLPSQMTHMFRPSDFMAYRFLMLFIIYQTECPKIA